MKRYYKLDQVYTPGINDLKLKYLEAEECPEGYGSIYEILIEDHPKKTVVKPEVVAPLEIKEPEPKVKRPRKRKPKAK